MPRERKTALIQFHLFLAEFKDFGVDEFDKLVFIISRRIFRHIPVIQADEKPAHHANLRAGQAKAVGVEQGFLHIVEQYAQSIVKLDNRAANFFQDRIAVLNNCAKSHLIVPPEYCWTGRLHIPVRIEIERQCCLGRELFFCISIKRRAHQGAERRIIAAL